MGCTGAVRQELGALAEGGQLAQLAAELDEARGEQRRLGATAAAAEAARDAAVARAQELQERVDSALEDTSTLQASAQGPGLPAVSRWPVAQPASGWPAAHDSCALLHTWAGGRGGRRLPA